MINLIKFIYFVFYYFLKKPIKLPKLLSYFKWKCDDDGDGDGGVEGGGGGETSSKKYIIKKIIIKINWLINSFPFFSFFVKVGYIIHTIFFFFFFGQEVSYYHHHRNFLYFLYDYYNRDNIVSIF